MNKSLTLMRKTLTYMETRAYPKTTICFSDLVSDAILWSAFESYFSDLTDSMALRTIKQRKIVPTQVQEQNQKLLAKARAAKDGTARFELAERCL